MARSIQESNYLIICCDLVSPDMLGNASGFLINYICFSNRIQKFSLAMINMTQNNHHRWPNGQVISAICCIVRHLSYNFSILGQFYQEKSSPLGAFHFHTAIASGSEAEIRLGPSASITTFPFLTEARKL